MHHPDHQGEVRPVPTPASGSPPAIPLLSLRGERRVIPPEACRLGDDCLVCRWRRAGLLDKSPGTEAA